MLGNWKFLYGANDLQKGVELLCWFQTVIKPKPNVCKTCSEVRVDTVGAFTEQIMLNRQSRFVISTSFVRWKLELSYRMLKDLMENYCSHVPCHSIKVITRLIFWVVDSFAQVSDVAPGPLDSIMICLAKNVFWTAMCVLFRL